MTTARTVLRPTPRPDLTSRRRRRLQRQRVVRQELTALAVLVLVLMITLVLLGLQWLDAGTASGSSLRISHLLPEVTREVVWS